MEKLYEEVKKRLDLIEDMYDVIRIVDPVNKEKIHIKDGGEIEKLEGTCYSYWKKGTSCSNCIANRAYIEESTFAKIEPNINNYVIVIATPIIINEKTYVVEMLKSMKKGKKIFEYDNKEVIKGELTDLFNDIYEDEIKKINLEIEDDFIEINDCKISMLEKKIDEVREQLNEMCELRDRIGKDSQILDTSQTLDDLIVEYMKEKYIYK